MRGERRGVRLVLRWQLSPCWPWEQAGLTAQFPTLKGGEGEYK